MLFCFIIYYLSYIDIYSNICEYEMDYSLYFFNCKTSIL